MCLCGGASCSRVPRDPPKTERWCALFRLNLARGKPRCIPILALRACRKPCPFPNLRRCARDRQRQRVAGPRRSGSQKRQRQFKIGVGCDAAEFLVIGEKARAAGLSLASYLRACALGSAGPRAQRAPTVNAEALAHATAALNKVGSNLNQLTRAFHSGGARITAQELFAVLKDVRAAVSRILEIAGRKERS